MHVRILTALMALALALPVNALSPSKGSLKPTVRKQFRKDHINYNNCRKKVVQRIKHSDDQESDLRKELQACNDQFPHTAIYVRCKSQVLKNFKKNPQIARQKLADCREVQAASIYQPESPVQYFSAEGRSFFAGVDMYKHLPHKQVKQLHNYDCSQIDRVLGNQFDEAEYLLFGNAPRLYQPFSRLPEAELKNVLNGKLERGEDPFYDIAGFGRLYEFSSSKPMVLFPTSHCYFASEPGKLFEDHKFYFLLDRVSSTLTPYFGVSFFLADQQRFDMQRIAKLLLERLGSGYKAFDIRKKTVIFFGKIKPNEFDLEGDPKNLCAHRDKQKIVALLRRDPERPSHPSTLIVANLAHACDFGEKLARRLLGHP